MLRLLGKRQIGQLQPYEFALTLIAADLATTPMSNINTPLLWGIIPIYVLLVAGMIISLLSMKSIPLRKLICGTPRMLIDRGVIIEDSLRAVRYTINDLLEQLRAKDYFDISEVYYAILETNGEISVIPKSAYKPLTPDDMNITVEQEQAPVTIIIDGELQRDNLKIFNKDEAWVNGVLKKEGFKDIKSILLMTFDNKNVYIQSCGNRPKIKESK